MFQERTRKHRIQHLLDNYSTERLSYAAHRSVRSGGKRDTATLIAEVRPASARRATTYKNG